MKKTVPFEIFGANQYLMFDVLRLAELERVIGKPIAMIVATQDIGVDFTLKALSIAMKQHFHQATPEFFAEKLEEHLETGGDFNDICVPVVRAIMASGLLGKAVANRALGIVDDEVPEEPKNESPAAAKPSKRSKNG